MTSLSDVYEGRVGRVVSRRQKLLGTGLFLTGAVLVVAAIAVSTTGVAYRTFGELVAREFGGILAGIGLQAVLLGVFVVLPSSRRLRAAAVIGTGVSLFGVLLFRYAYPYQWVESAPLLALGTSIVYFFGVVTTFWCLFVALATFKTRRDPGGTARMEITREGTIRLVEEASSMGGIGGVGLFGADPDGSVKTQTNVDSGTGSAAGTKTSAPSNSTVESNASTASTTSTGSRPTVRSSTPVSDGGSTATVTPTNPSPSPGSVDTQSAETASTKPDAYCGNCRHFEYISGEDEPVPYCGFHDRELDDMDACSAWFQHSR